jgi:hypothetical protein
LSSVNYIALGQPGRLVRDVPYLKIGLGLGLIMLCGNPFDWCRAVNTKGGLGDKDRRSGNSLSCYLSRFPPLNSASSF